MSGYRNLHRQQVVFHNDSTAGGGEAGGGEAGAEAGADGAAIWSLCTTPTFSDMTLTSSAALSASTGSSSTTTTPHWRVWMACSDGLIRGYRILEKNHHEKLNKQKKKMIAPKATEGDGNDDDDDDAKEEKQVEEEQEELSASAVQLQFTHILSSPSTSSNDSSSPDSSFTTGCTALSSVVINIPDTSSSSSSNKSNSSSNKTLVVVLAAMDMAGILRVWTLPATVDHHDDNMMMMMMMTLQHQPETISSTVNINLPNATGTTALLVPPVPPLSTTTTTTTTTTDNDNNGIRLDNHNHVLLVAVGCINGTIALVSTGISLQDDGGESSSCSSGTIVQVWGVDDDDDDDNQGKGGKEGKSASLLAVPLVLAWQPTLTGTRGRASSTASSHRRGRSCRRTLAVGRLDGHVHVYTSYSSLSLPPQSSNRLDSLFGSPVRAVTFTTDGHLLIAGNDHGHLCLWDCSRQLSSLQTSSLQQPPVLVHHFHQAHASWILNVTAIHERSFLSLGADCRVKVWNVGQMDHGHAIHVFSSFFTNTTPSITASSNTNASTTNNNSSSSSSTKKETITTSTHGDEKNKDETVVVQPMLQLPPPPPRPLPMLWSMARGPTSTARFVTGSDHGWLQIYSLE